MSGNTGTHRAQKRQRAGHHELSDSENVRSAITALLERLGSVRSNAVAVKSEHLISIANIDERIAAKQTALRAVARVVPPPPSEDIAKFSRGVPAAEAPTRQSENARPPLPAMKLLVEQDPPEKLIHEQSVIVRAQAINRKNAELARERLPKQPEAQRNKTHWDYLMDEAVWLATDFREERKWKMRIARSLAKAAATYHVQKKLREARAIREEQARIRKLATSIARDVKKFWSQVRELGAMRHNELEEIRLNAERREQLDSCLKQAAKMTSNVALSLQNAPETAEACTAKTSLGTPATAEGMPMTSSDLALEQAKNAEVSGSQEKPSSPSTSNREAKRSDKTSKEAAADFDEKNFTEADVEDDEATMDVAEAEEERDPKETSRLQAEAEMTIEELLASQGIDLASYAADNKQYLSDEEDSAEEDTESSERSVGSSAESDDEDNGTPLASDDHGPVKTIITASGQRFVPQSSTVPADGRPAAFAKPSADEKRVVYQPQLKSVTPSAVEAERILENQNVSNSQATPASSLTTKETDNARDTSSVPGKVLMNGTKPAVKPAVSSSVRPPSGLLRGTLRDYQFSGMQWLISLYKNNVNGILADEMGLGKTIQTIALLAWLALEEGIWGPHLIVVPTSVMVNWEVEFKKWAPGFKILTYFGSLKERKAKRVGWTRPNTFHVCITSYALVVQDAAALRRKEWSYLILDEAHNIKNFQSQRWQTLLRFPAARRLLLTGTPLQNSIMELWSLMHFLMPKMFESQAQFKDWFAKPLGAIASNSETAGAKESVDKLHEILRPFLLRRLKRDVEKSLPPKVEHVQKCPLSKRQRQLYEDFLSRSDTQSTLQSGEFFGVMGVLMQLRKVCNHPDLFEGRPILSPFAMKPVFFPVPSLVMKMKSVFISNRVDLSLMSLDLSTDECKGWNGHWHATETQRLSAVPLIVEKLGSIQEHVATPTRSRMKRRPEASVEAARRVAAYQRAVLKHQAQLTSLKLRKRALLGEDMLRIAMMTPASFLSSKRQKTWDNSFGGSISLVKPLEAVVKDGNPILERFVCSIRKVSAPLVELRFAGDDRYHSGQRSLARSLSTMTSPLRTLFRTAEIRSSVTLPDARLVQWDCGKLQVLADLLRKLKQRSSRVLIFSQMSKVLNILETFLNLHAHRYLRLDGATKTGERQRIVERFNTDTRIFCMILTTRAGGVGLNLTGADTVIFYDTDYNPAIDAQAQDRVHRIGQKKPVHIYRLVSERTVEENILRRANEKRTLESLVISQAGFNIDSFQNRAALNDLVGVKAIGNTKKRSTSPAFLSSGSGGASADQVKFAVEKNGQSSAQKNSFRASGTNGSSADASRIRNSNAVPILSAHGPVTPLAWVEMESKAASTASPIAANGHGDDPSLKHLAEESDVYHRLVAEDDGSANNANTMSSDKEEFYDEDVSTTGNGKDARAPAFETIERSLTPIQRLALKFIEQRSHVRVVNAGDLFYPETEEPPEAKPGEPNSEPRPSLSNGVVNGDINAADASDSADGPPTSDDDDEDDVFFYNQQTTNSAYLSSLKALTDTDVNIKLYLPLRDGGPEELKISSVVNGTAAAGLECAEDAAFFPHAYNRMSRTIYATKRQKEKAAANLRKREELEEKRKRDAAKAAALRAGSGQRQGQSSTGVDMAGSGVRVVGQKSKQDASNIGRTSTAMKRPRVEGGSRARLQGSSAGGSLGTPGDGSFPGTVGIFRRTMKRNPRRLSSLYGKSSINFTANAMFGETMGDNDGWTTEEDKLVTELVSQYCGNMALVADALAIHPDVVAGNRRVRSIRHITDRWFNVIQKEAKTGQTGIKPAIPGAAVSSKNLALFARAAQKSSASYHKLDVKSIEFSEIHASHPRAALEAQKRPAFMFSPKTPPTFSSTQPKITVPRGHLPGFKAHECTPQALSKKKVPFVRTPRNDSRSSLRGSAGATPQPSQPPPGPSRVGSSVSGSGNAKAVPARSLQRMQPSFPPVSRGQPRTQTAAVPPVQRTTSQASVQNTSGARVQGVGAGTILPPGTSARMSIGQYGNAQNAIGAVRLPSTFNVGSTVPVGTTGRQSHGRPAAPNGSAVGLQGLPTAIRPTPAAANSKVGVSVAQQRRLSALNARKLPVKAEQARGPSPASKVIQKHAPQARKIVHPHPSTVGQKPKVHPAQAASTTVARPLSVVPKILTVPKGPPMSKPIVGNSASIVRNRKPVPKGRAEPPPTPQAIVGHASMPTGSTARVVHGTARKVAAPMHPVPQTIALVPPTQSAKRTAAAGFAVTGNTSVAPSVGLQKAVVHNPRKGQVDGYRAPGKESSSIAAGAPKQQKLTGEPTASSSAQQAPKPASLPMVKAPVTNTKVVENGIQTASVSDPAKILIEKNEEPKPVSK